MDAIEITEQYQLTTPGARTLDRLHVSDIYNDIADTLFPPKKGGGDRTNPLWAEVGFLWERVLTEALKEHLGVRIGEVELDGIVCSPDGFDNTTGILDEYKCTWKSSKNHPKDRWAWMTQLKAYCKVLGTCTARMFILYVNGDYKENFGPQYKVFLFCFTEREIEENWSMLVNHAKSKGWLP